MSLNDRLNDADDAREECRCSDVPALRAEVALWRGRARDAEKVFVRLAVADDDQARDLLLRIQHGLREAKSLLDGSQGGSADSGPESNVSAEGVAG